MDLFYTVTTYYVKTYGAGDYRDKLTSAEIWRFLTHPIGALPLARK